MRVAIHQPNFLPWLGIFHRIAQVDRFVFFDHIHAPTGKSWVYRNRILLNGAADWITIPIHRSGRSTQTIAEVEINYATNFPRKHLGTLAQAYRKSPCFAEMMSIVEGLYDAKPVRVVDFNGEFIRRVCARLGLATTFVHSSELERAHPELTDLRGNDLVLATCRAARAAHYVSGEGCLDFIRPDSFAAAGIDFHFQNFRHPQYPQVGAAPFVSHLSVLDAIANVGFEGVKSLLAGQPPRHVAGPAGAFS